MTRSSGVNVYPIYAWAKCSGTATHTFGRGTPDEHTESWPCTVEGDQEIQYDHDTAQAWWECHACGTSNEYLSEDALKGLS